MKILAIRGRNLASLHGDFELDFTSSPLFGCGLFAITGETGAGKSTILDAMCLALYGRFPRITGDGQKDKVENTRGESLQTSDPRSILRTGATDAYAQVDLMVDGQTLRASWQVRRARGKAEGNLLAFERGLIDLKDQSVLASGKMRVDEEITKRLKLTYEQFGRTVLLAQNDFDAFLRANDADRADLLEKITGTELYSKISAKAFEKERQALRVLEDLQQKTGFITVLGDEERQSLLIVIKNTEQSDAELQKQDKQARTNLEWFGRRDEALVRITEAENQVKEAAVELESLQDTKQLLGRIERAASLRTLIDKVDQVDLSLQFLHEQQAQRNIEKNDLKSRIKTSKKDVQLSQTRFESCEKASNHAAPLFEQALKLDTQISSDSTRNTEGQAALVQAQAQQAEVSRHKTEHETVTQEMRTRLDALKQVLSQSAALKPVSKRSKDLEVQFQQLKDFQVDLADAKRLQHQKKHDFKNLQERVQSDKAEREILQSDLAKARLQRDEKIQILSKLKPDEIRLKRDQQIDFQNQLNMLLQHLILVSEKATLIDKTMKNRREAEAKKDRASEELQQLEVKLQDLKSKAAEAGDMLTRSQTILSKHVLQLRSDLRKDQPCPVCGSSDHPGHDDQEVTDLLDLMRERTRELSQNIKENEEQRSKLQQHREKANSWIENAHERLEGAQGKLEELKSHSFVLYQHADEAAIPLDVHITRKRELSAQLDHLKSLQDANDHHMVNVRKQVMTIQHLETENHTRTECVQELEKSEQRQLAENSKREGRQQRAEDELREANNKHGLVRGHREIVLKQILSLLGGVDLSRADLERDPTTAEQFIYAEIKRYDTQKHEVKQIKEGLEARQREAAVFTEKTEHQQERIAELETDLAKVKKHLKAQQQERATLFDGRSVTTVRAEMKQAYELATDALQEARGRKRENATRLEEVDKNLTRLNVSSKKEQQARNQTVGARDLALREQKMDLADVLSLLTISIVERDEMMQRLEKQKHNQTKSAALLLDRKQQLKRINAQPKPSGSRGDISDELQDVEAKRAMLMIDLGKNKSLLELDDEALKKRKKLSGSIEKVEKNHALWAVMNEAIGSKHGDKFRKFVQGVTLDHLVALANDQLRNINPRYKIERNTIGGLGLQVIDVEMGGEVRSVRSLSGGERFLVSLALALGLSQLDGRSSFVDTLMIDEGFGTLDSRSLDIVIEALESLQSQGRKVGVISHVEALKDRIPVQIRVEKQGDGRSRVRVVEPGIMGRG